MSNTTEFKIHVPIGLLQYGLDRTEIEQRVTEWLVLSLFTEGRISSGKAARLLNIPRVAFLALLRERGIDYLNYSPDEVAEELAAVEALKTGSS